MTATNYCITVIMTVAVIVTIYDIVTVTDTDIVAVFTQGSRARATISHKVRVATAANNFDCCCRER